MTGSPLRVVALDVGERRIGVAATDALGLTVQPLDAIRRGRARADDLRAIALVVQARGATHVIVGHPLRLDGGRGTAARRMERFTEALRDALGVPCELVDERFTTVEAERRMIEAGVRRAQRRAHVDSMAAALLLDAWLGARLARPADGDEEAL